MAKLRFVFKKAQEDWTNLEETDLSMDLYNGNSTLYIGTKENRSLKEIAKQVKDELVKRTFLKEDEELEISEFDKYVMDFEENQTAKIDSTSYNACKKIYDYVHPIKILEKEGVTNASN